MNFIMKSIRLKLVLLARAFGLLYAPFHMHKLNRVKRLIWGFSDSLVASRRIYNPPHSLNAMLKEVGVDKYQSHDALEDAQDVRTLIRRMAKQHDWTAQEFVRVNE